MYKIVLFVPYFGPLPAHMALWVKSCAANPSIDWVLLTDQELSFPLPDNMRYKKTTLPEIKERFSERLGFDVCIDKPYKLVDFKPAYGYLFQDMLGGYDFWGHCDVDVIFGDIRAFFFDELLSRYDKIQALGHLTFYRNTETANTLFMARCPGVAFYRDVFTDSRIYCFDEWHGIYEICRQRGVAQADERVMAAIRPFTGHFQDSISGWDRVIFYWEAGKVFMVRLEKDAIETREVPYVHFRKRAMAGPSFDAEQAKAFYLAPNIFLPKTPGVLTRQDVIEKRKGVPLYGLVSRVKRLRRKGLKGFFQRLWVRGMEAKSARNHKGDTLG